MKDSIPLAPLQRYAWFNLIVFATTVALYVVAVPALAWYFHRTLAAAALPSLGLFGLCGIWGFGSYFFYDRRRRAIVKLDERENSIYLRAGTIGFALSLQVFVFLCMGVWRFGATGITAPPFPSASCHFWSFWKGLLSG